MRHWKAGWEISRDSFWKILPSMCWTEPFCRGTAPPQSGYENSVANGCPKLWNGNFSRKIEQKWLFWRFRVYQLSKQQQTLPVFTHPYWQIIAQIYLKTEKDMIFLSHIRHSTDLILTPVRFPKIWCIISSCTSPSYINHRRAFWKAPVLDKNRTRGWTLLLGV